LVLNSEKVCCLLVLNSATSFLFPLFIPFALNGTPTPGVDGPGANERRRGCLRRQSAAPIRQCVAQTVQVYRGHILQCVAQTVHAKCSTSLRQASANIQTCRMQMQSPLRVHLIGLRGYHRKVLDLTCSAPPRGRGASATRKRTRSASLPCLAPVQHRVGSRTLKALVSERDVFDY
jgi:hypothetical protein